MLTTELVYAMQPLENVKYFETECVLFNRCCKSKGKYTEDPYVDFYNYRHMLNHVVCREILHDTINEYRILKMHSIKNTLTIKLQDYLLRPEKKMI